MMSQNPERNVGVGKVVSRVGWPIVVALGLCLTTTWGTGRAGVARATLTEDPKEFTNEKPQVPQLRKLTDAEIHRIRFLELRGMRLGVDSNPESITVKLDPKIVEEFLVRMEGKPNYTGQKARGEFRKLTAAQKVHLIAAERGAEYADRIKITSDTEVFVEFRKKIMPLILRGCATTGCHGPTESDDVRFHLFKDPKKTPATAYANFIILNDVQVDGVPILNRSQPENSLLLSYMLPTKDVKPEMRHPGSMEYKSLFLSKNAIDYKRIEKWIGTLKHPREDYGVHLYGGREATTQFSDDEPSNSSAP